MSGMMVYRIQTHQSISDQSSLRWGTVISSISLSRIRYFFFTLFLLFIPFQRVLVRQLNFDKKLLYIDEVVSLIFIFTIPILILMKGRVRREIQALMIPVATFIVVGMTSGLYNGNEIIITGLGIFDYVKLFFYIFGCCYFFADHEFLKFIYKILLKLAVLLVLIALIQETVYFLNGNVRSFFTPVVLTRFGMLRTPSLLGHPNLFGLYALLFFTLNLFVTRRIDFTNSLLLIGTFLSVSRFIWISTLVVMMVFILKSKKILYKLFICIVAVYFAIVAPSFIKHTNTELFSQDFYRGYALFISLEIWRDHKLLGAGPGMYGGVVSVKFNSPIYDSYSFSALWYQKFLQRIHSIDLFWPQVLAETGVCGFLTFTGLLFVAYMVPRRLSYRISDSFLKALLMGMSYIPIVIGIYLFGSGLNLTGFLVTYASLLGISIGVAQG